MTRMTGPDCVVMCNLINTYIHTTRLHSGDDRGVVLIVITLIKLIIL